VDWFKGSPNAWIGGTRELTLEERGAYNDIIHLLYARDGDLPDDEKFIARYLGCRPQVWRRLRALLLAKGKIHFKADGKLTANRVETELKHAHERIEKMARLGRVSALKRKEINELVSTALFNGHVPYNNNNISKKRNLSYYRARGNKGEFDEE